MTGGMSMFKGGQCNYNRIRSIGIPEMQGKRGIKGLFLEILFPIYHWPMVLICNVIHQPSVNHCQPGNGFVCSDVRQ